VWVAIGVDGYRITTIPDFNGQPNPLAKAVEKSPGAWLDNYGTYRWMIVAPLAAFAGGFGVIASARTRHPLMTLSASAMAVTGVILTAGLSMFPFIMPSSSNPASSLTAWDSVSSWRTLQIMFWVTVFFVPLIALYTSWVYAKLRGTITLETIRSED
jgi:cytochrome d ubiquinol oxidase subunit II